MICSSTFKDMQWLQSDHEANATLCEALAFIDAFDTSTSSSATGDYSSGVKKKRSHRDRVKSELQRLRNDASALEVTLTRLKQSLRRSIQESSSQSHQRRPVSLIDSTADADSTSNDPRVAAWMEVAMDEYRRRRQSEATNRQLKDLLAKQIELVRASEAALVFKLTEAVGSHSLRAWGSASCDCLLILCHRISMRFTTRKWHWFGTMEWAKSSST